jgi:hypothetical protein
VTMTQIDAPQTERTARGSHMTPCTHCREAAEWKHKDGWGVLACDGWFSGRCGGLPLGVIFPSVGNIRPLGGNGNGGAAHAKRIKKRLRELWPVHSLV